MKKSFIWLILVIAICGSAYYAWKKPIQEYKKLHGLNNIRIYKFDKECGYTSALLDMYFKWNDNKADNIYGSSSYPLGVFYLLKKEDEKIKCIGSNNYLFLDMEVSDDIYISLNKNDLPFSKLIKISNYYNSKGELTYSKLFEYVYAVNKHYDDIEEQEKNIEDAKLQEIRMKRINEEKLHAEKAKKELNNIQ